MKPKEFLRRSFAAASEAAHIFPEFAACEAALESAWGESRLCREANNLFGQKQSRNPLPFPTVQMLTREWDAVKKEFVWHRAEWLKFSDWPESFRARMERLRALAVASDADGNLRFPGYSAALTAVSGADFVCQVGRHWATDPTRANKVLTIHRIHRLFLDGLNRELTRA